MDITRTLAAGAVGLALLVGAGCGKIGEKVAEEAIENSSGCTDIDVQSGSGGGLSGSCDGTEFDADASGGASLPTGWPAELALPDGAKIIASTGTDGNLSVTAGLDGDLAAVTQGIRDQLETAGFTIDDDTSVDNAGIGSSSLSATGAEHTTNVVLTEQPNAVEGNLTIVYTLTPAAG